MERCRQDKTADSNISNLHLASLLGSQEEAKAIIVFSLFRSSGALNFLDTCHQILTKTTLVDATIRASRYDAGQQLK